LQREFLKPLKQLFFKLRQWLNRKAAACDWMSLYLAAHLADRPRQLAPRHRNQLAWRRAVPSRWRLERILNHPLKLWCIVMFFALGSWRHPLAAIYVARINFKLKALRT
jgi:hypothetical protein